MVAETQTLRIAGVLEQVTKACEFVAASARAAGLDDRAVYHCDLAVDEACTNIIKYGFENQGEGRFIDLICEQDDGYFTITIREDSPAFDPLSVPNPARAVSIENAVPGGLGIFFIRQFMDQVEYQYREGQNLLILRKRIPVPIAQAMSVSRTAQSIRVAEMSIGGRLLHVIHPSGRVDAASAEAFAQMISETLDQGHTCLLVDMESVDFISSTGLKNLVMARKRAIDLRGDLILAAPRLPIREQLEVNGWHLILNYGETLEEASTRLRC